MYDVYFQDKIVGQVSVQRNGLYYQIKCSCHFPDKRQYRIHAISQSGDKDLGTCVPFGDAFGFYTTVSVRSIGDGELRFEAIPAVTEMTFFNVCNEEKFTHLHRLRESKFQVRDGTPGVVIPK